jgi:signal-transduction protein with cAMP-binding, CBS, and nucleotidyltransferase domain
MGEPKEIENEYGDEYLTVSKERAQPRITVDEGIFNHPIRDLNYHPPLCMQRTGKLNEAVALMRQHSVGAVMIQEGETLVGILSERDIVRKALGSGADFSRTTVDQYMTPDPEVVILDDTVARAVFVMHGGGFRHLPIVDDRHRPVGIVSVKDILEYFVGFFAHTLLTRPPKPRREYTPRVEGG